MATDKQKLNKIQRDNRRKFVELGLATLGMVMSEMEVEEISKEIHRTRGDYSLKDRALAMRYCRELIEKIDKGDRVVL